MKTLSLLLLCLSVTLLTAQDITTLMPSPKTAYKHTGESAFTLSQQAVIVLPDTSTPEIDRAIAFLQSEVKKRTGLTLTTVGLAWYVLSQPPSAPNAIIILPLSSKFASSFTQRLLNRIESVDLPSGSYIVDVRRKEAVVFCREGSGALYGISTVLQLLNTQSKSIAASHVWDAPDYPLRWVFSQHNLLVNSNLATLKTIADTMSFYKLNGLQQNDFKYNILDQMFDRYFNNVDTLKNIYAERMIDIIPGVCNIGWSDGILYHDPNLAEGLLAQTTYRIEGDSGRLLPDTRVSLPNGGFEQVSNGKFTGWGFYDDSFTPDNATVHSGNISAHATNFRQANSSGNARVSRNVLCQPNGYYVMSAWIKTNNWKGGFFQLLAIGNNNKGVSRTLTFTALDIPSTTNGWQRVEVCFNTLESVNMNLYCGLWGGDSGEFWIDDFEIHPAGLTNILRRAGTPVRMANIRTDIAYTEGIDFEGIIDPLVEQNKGSFGPYHAPPKLRRIPGGNLNNGDTVDVWYYHPFTAVSDNQGNGSVMVCVSEDTLYSILNDQISRVNNLYHPQHFFMGHDEIRNMNHDAACSQRSLSPAQLLADNLWKCDSLIKRVSTNSRRFVWSDMFDSLHNATYNYYLINGDLRGDWDLIPKNLTIVNWNGGKAEQSLEFFGSKGFCQISSPYYDAGNTSTIRSWRLAQEAAQNKGVAVDGMMYTTWASDFRFLRAFAYYAWSAGPYIMHQPLDSSIFAKATVVSAEIKSDPYDNSDAITSATLVIHKSSISQATFRIDMKPGATPNVWQVDFMAPNAEWLRYSIESENKQGIKRSTPQYEVWRSTPTSVEQLSLPLLATLAPNPTSGESLLRFSLPTEANSGEWRVHITDMLGREVYATRGRGIAGEECHLSIPALHLAAGIYSLSIEAAGRRSNLMLVRE